MHAPAALAATASSERPTALHRLREIPPDVRWRITRVIGSLVAAVVGFNWVYERNEPTWTVPAVRWLAMFFPAAGKA